MADDHNVATERHNPELTIGISAFTSTFHPSIDPLLVKTYILSMTRRPFTPKPSAIFTKSG